MKVTDIGAALDPQFERVSDTPRTDTAEIEGHPFSYVDAEFSRYLERELVAARAEIVRLKGEAESWEKVFDRTCELLAEAKTDVERMHLSPVERRAAGQPHCPICYTFGNSHRNGCKYANDGMDNHIRSNQKG